MAAITLLEGGHEVEVGMNAAGNRYLTPTHPRPDFREISIQQRGRSSYLSTAQFLKDP